jgi:hypothetical protein
VPTTLARDDEQEHTSRLLLLVRSGRVWQASGDARMCLVATATVLELAGERELTRADVVPMQRVQRVRHSGASVGHRSEHLADITWDAHVRATAGAECRKRIP